MARTLAVVLLVILLAIPAPPAAALSVEDDLVSLVAMPLAVAAVSEITDVPVNDLIDFVTLLNDADVPPVQFVEVVRYVPVALVVVDDTQPRFIEVVRVQEQAGVRGTALVTFIEERLNTYGLPTVVDLDVTAPRVFVDTDDFVPVVVRTRVASAKAHPHGGPPGQLKKQRGVQTGAEVVHSNRVVVDDKRTVVHIAPHPIPAADSNRGKGKKDKIAKNDDRGPGKDKPKAKGHGDGNGKGKGKGKG